MPETKDPKSMTDAELKAELNRCGQVMADGVIDMRQPNELTKAGQKASELWDVLWDEKLKRKNNTQFK